MKYKSKFKHLVVSGCSFTTNLNSPGPYAWPNMLADWTGMEVHNLAVAGAGNDHISKSIILYLEQKKLEPDDTLVMAMWSGVGRIDWITDKNLSNFKDLYPFAYYYDTCNELVLGGNWWNNRNADHLTKTLKEYSKYQSESTFALHSWLAMTSLTNYLITRGYQFYYTSFIDYATEVKGDAVSVDFLTELKKLNLTLNKTHWLHIDSSDHYGNWARKNKLLDVIDDFHPSGDAPERWPREVLIPYLVEQGILYE